MNEWGNVILDTKPSPVGNLSTDLFGRPVDEGQKIGKYNWSTNQDFSRNNVKFNEGDKHPVPVAGDIVVKADGTEVKIDYYRGVDGQVICLRAIGCDIWTGTQTPLADGSGYREITVGSNGFFAGDQGSFRKSPYCDEVYTADMAGAYSRKGQPAPTRDGNYEGEQVDLYVWVQRTLGYEWVFMAP